MNPINIWEKSSLDSRNGVCKDPLACSKKGREASVTGWSRVRRKIGEEVSKVVRDQVTEGFMEPRKGF